MTLNPALNHAGHDADAEKVGLVEGSFSVNLVRKVTEDVKRRRHWCELEDDTDGTGTYGNTDGFSKFNVPLKTAGFMNHDCGMGRDPVADMPA